MVAMRITTKQGECDKGVGKQKKFRIQSIIWSRPKVSFRIIRQNGWGWVGWDVTYSEVYPFELTSIRAHTLATDISLPLPVLYYVQASCSSCKNE